MSKPVKAPDIRELLAYNVRALRLERGLSQEGLGQMLGCHRTHISHVEQGALNITADNVQKLADVLNVSVARLFDGPKSEGAARR